MRFIFHSHTHTHDIVSITTFGELKMFHSQSEWHHASFRPHNARVCARCGDWRGHEFGSTSLKNVKIILIGFSAVVEVDSWFGRRTPPVSVAHSTPLWSTVDTFVFFFFSCFIWSTVDSGIHQNVMWISSIVNYRILSSHFITLLNHFEC